MNMKLYVVDEDNVEIASWSEALPEDPLMLSTRATDGLCYFLAHCIPSVVIGEFSRRLTAKMNDRVPGVSFDWTMVERAFVDTILRREK